MNNENSWNDKAEKLRRHQGLCPLTAKEAEQALKKINPRKLSDQELDSIVDSITAGYLPDLEVDVSTDWTPDCDYADIDRQAALFRNQGEGNTETDSTEEELLKELMKDDGLENDPNEMEN